MDRLYTLLCLFEQNSQLSQREVAEKSGCSLGMVNTLIKTMQERELLLVRHTEKRKQYCLTEKGTAFLNNMIREKQLMKTAITKKTTKRVKKAVILAAGQKKEFPQLPVDLLPLEEEVSNLSRMIALLHDQEIFDILIVIGNKKELYYELYGQEGVKFIENDRYLWSGSMYSLFLAHECIDDDFILLESDHIFEKRILQEALDHEEDTCLVMRSMCEEGNDCYIETDQHGYIFRISKDIRQMNHIDGIMTGIHKISYDFYQKMLDIYKENQNPLLNYEFLIETLARYFAVPVLYLDDALCWDMNTQAIYEKVCNQYYKLIKKRERVIDQEALKQLFAKIMVMDIKDIEKIVFAGGMTNANYKVSTLSGNYILRIPGKCTEEMISRKQEKYNSKLAYLLDLNVDTIYFNEQEGIKITRFVDHAETLSPQTARQEENMIQTSALMRKLHDSNVELQSTFDVAEELLKYEQLVKEANTSFYPGYEAVRKTFFALFAKLDELGWEALPCHNDLVAENFIKNEQRMYLIDWEYAGKNDPMWDVAAHLIECEFSKQEEALFLQYYFKGRECTAVHRQKILICKILQDVLWSVWTIAKEAKGEDFGTYGIDRMRRAQKMVKEYHEQYGE